MKKFDVETPSLYSEDDPRERRTHPMWTEVYLASEVDARIAELQEALHRFGIHPIECEAMRAGSDETQCDCGLYRLTRPL